MFYTSPPPRDIQSTHQLNATSIRDTWDAKPTNLRCDTSEEENNDTWDVRPARRRIRAEDSFIVTVSQTRHLITREEHPLHQHRMLQISLKPWQESLFGCNTPGPASATLVEGVDCNAHSSAPCGDTRVPTMLCLPANTINLLVHSKWINS